MKVILDAYMLVNFYLINDGLSIDDSLLKKNSFKLKIILNKQPILIWKKKIFYRLF